MDGACDLTRGRRDATDIAIGLERMRDLHTEVDIHRLVSMRRLVIEEQIVSRPQMAIRSEEGPDLVERGLPDLRDTADGCPRPHGGHQFRRHRLHLNLISHR